MTFPSTFFAWCFSHGRMHHFDGEPWCTASWVGFTAATEQAALEAKQHAYGDAEFLDQLPVDKQIEVIEIGEGRR